MNWPSVGVIIPTRHRPHMTERAARSALEQDYPGTLEVIVVDDGSEDDSAEHIEAALGSRARVIRRPFAGPSAARNAGFLASRASFICFLDSDDCLAPRYCHKLISALHETGCRAAAVGIQHHAADGVIWDTCLGTRNYVLSQPATEQLNLWRPLPLIAGNVVYTRELIDEIGGWDETSREGEGFEFHARVCSRLSTLALVAGTALKSYHHEGDRLRQEVEQPSLGRYLARCLEQLEADLEAGNGIASCYRSGCLTTALGWGWSWLGVRAYENGDGELGARAAVAWGRLGARGPHPPGAPRALRWCARLPVPAPIRLRSTARLLRTLSRFRGWT